MSRYLGDEPCTSPEQVVRYLEQNYVDDDGRPMPTETARAIAKQGAEAIRKGIDVFRSNVYYLGDEALKESGEHGWHELPEPDEDDEEDED